MPILLKDHLMVHGLKGYYFVLFEDPDRIRLEVNYVPGKGNLEPGINKSMHNPTSE